MPGQAIGRRQHAARKDVFLDEIRIPAIGFEVPVVNRDDLHSGAAGIGQPRFHLIEKDRPILLADRLEHLNGGDMVKAPVDVPVVA